MNTHIALPLDKTFHGKLLTYHMLAYISIKIQGTNILYRGVGNTIPVKLWVCAQVAVCGGISS